MFASAFSSAMEAIFPTVQAEEAGQPDQGADKQAVAPADKGTTDDGDEAEEAPEAEEEEEEEEEPEDVSARLERLVQNTLQERDRSRALVVGNARARDLCPLRVEY